MMTQQQLLEPNPPQWPASVKIFYPHHDPKTIMEQIKETEDDMEVDPTKTKTVPSGMTYTSSNHFTTNRWALLFAPGIYEGVDFEVGYYVQVLGLGANAQDVRFTKCRKGPFVPALNKFDVRYPWGLGLDSFWRSAENFKSEAAEGMEWVVSQAAPLRRVHIGTDLHLCAGDAYVSGGVLANAIVDGKTNFGGQQQFLSRNVHFGQGAVGGAWSLVFVGCTGQVPSPSDKIVFGERNFTPEVTVQVIPRIRIEKPFIEMKENGDFVLHVPSIASPANMTGPHLEGETDDVRDFSSVKVAIASDGKDLKEAGIENHATIQRALDEGKDVVLCPGIFHLSDSIILSRPNQVILGLGLATLDAPTNGQPCIKILANVPGIRIAGLMLEASGKGTKSLLEWGVEGEIDKGDASNPGVLTDVFARVGGASTDRRVSTEVIMRLNSGFVVGDNIWLWRADHVKLLPGEIANFPLNPVDPKSKLPRVSDRFYQVMEGECSAKVGLIVTGDDITMYGLAVEHTEEHQTIWKGNRGQVNFYQCELPYDVTQEFGDKKFRGYMVHDDVEEHEANMVGVYSNFRDHNVTVETAIEHPSKDGISISNAFTVLLDNIGCIESIINGTGGRTEHKGLPVRPSGKTECKGQLERLGGKNE